MSSKDDIWADDLLGRVSEADMIAAFVEGASRQAMDANTKGAVTLSVDAGYGEGKTFFLKRLAQQLELDHPVAFVDAWTDDLADDPLTALIATLIAAVAPVGTKDGANKVTSKLGVVVEKSGKIAKIVGWGLLKRAAGLVVTAGAVEASAEVLSSVGEDVKEAAQSGLEVSGQDLADGVNAIMQASPLKLMEQRVQEFEAGKAAMQELKDSLTSLVETLQQSGLEPPIVIIIDELDRCKPTYAIKLLEEIKHLFDVPGLVFIFGMHSSALSHSVKAAYGSDFDGAAYLRRFIQRRYRLAEPSHVRFVEHLVAQSGINTDRFEYHSISRPRRSVQRISLAELISEYMNIYEVSARDAFELVGMLETASALTGNRALLAPLLIPLAIGQMKGLAVGELPNEKKPPSFSFFVQKGHHYAGDEYGPGSVAKYTLDAANQPYDALTRLSEQWTPFQSAVYNTMSGNEPELLSAACNYPRLLSKVALLKTS